MKISVLASIFLGTSLALAAPQLHRRDNNSYEMCVSGCSSKKGGQTSFDKCVEDTCGTDRHGNSSGDGYRKHDPDEDDDDDDDDDDYDDFPFRA